jgi:serine/threonine-protein kinase
MDSFAARLQPLLGDRYRLTRELPGGGMSRVFLAHEPALKRDVVVKVLPPDLLTPRSRARFAQEMEVTARLQHPHILPVLSSGGDDTLTWYITPYVRGASLRERLVGAPVPLPEAVPLLADLAGALRFAHARGVLHRDLKPGNVLLAEGHAILADFGIARALADGDEPQGPAGSSSIGTELYAPPGGVVDAAGDLYALGRLAHHLLLGTLPVAPVTRAGVAAALARRHPEAPAAQGAALADVLVTLLAAAPAPGAVATGASVASAALVERQLRGALAPPPPERGGWPGRRRALVGAAALAAVAVAVAVGGWGWQATRAPGGARLAAGGGAEADAPMAAQVVALADTVGTTGLPPARGAGARGEAGADSVPPAVAAGRLGPDTARAEAPAPRSLPDSARLLVQAGDWEGALPVLREALATTPDAPALLLQAAVLVSLQQPPDSPGEEPRALLGRLAAVEGALTPEERALAEGFRLLARGAYPEAVAHFRALRGSLAIAPWALVGMGEALSRDVLVLPDAQSPSGYRFRTDANETLAVLADAMRSAPWVDRRWVLRQVVRAAPVETGRLRAGRDAQGTLYTGRMLAVGNRVETPPYRSGPSGTRLPPPSPESARALELHRERVGALLAQWRHEAPQAAHAWLLTAGLLEASGHIVTAGPDQLSALDAMARGRRLLRAGGEAALQHQRNHLRLYLRGGRFAEAAALADSALADIEQGSLLERDRGLPLALLTGRTMLAARLGEATAGQLTREVIGLTGQPVRLPAELLRERAAVFPFIAHGACTDAVRGAPGRLRALAVARIPEPERAPGFEAALLQELLEQGLPCLGPAPLAALNTGMIRRPTNRGAEALEAGRPASLVAMYAQLQRTREDAGAPPMLADEAVAIGVQLAAAGDTAAAYRVVTRSLDALPVVQSRFAEMAGPAGALGRAMLLAAEWGARVDAPGSARWLAAVDALWARADAPRRAEVARVRAVVSAARAAPAPAP